MSLRFLLDEDMSQRVAQGLRARGVDAISVHEVGRGNRRVPDEEQLGYAAEQGRVFVTYNRTDFQALDGQWRAQARRHAGILVRHCSITGSHHSPVLGIPATHAGCPDPDDSRVSRAGARALPTPPRLILRCPFLARRGCPASQPKAVRTGRPD